MPKQEELETDDLPGEAEHALYLITELAAVMEHARVADWPERQAETFRRRMTEILGKVGSF